jgi:hypothetical protein
MVLAGFFKVFNGILNINSIKTLLHCIIAINKNIHALTAQLNTKKTPLSKGDE